MGDLCDVLFAMLCDGFDAEQRDRMTVELRRPIGSSAESDKAAIEAWMQRTWG